MRFQAPKIQLPLIGEHRMRHSRHIRHIDSPHLCEGMSAPIGCQLSAYLKKWLWMTYAMLPFMMQWMPYAHAAIPELVSVSAADVTARSALITYVLSEPCDVQVVLYLDAQGTIRSTDHIVQSTPFRTSTTTTRASQRNLGASRLERLTPNTDYFAKLVLTSKSTLQVKTFPVSGTIAFTTGALINLQDFGGQTFSDAVIYDLTPSLGTAAGSLALLDVEGALSPLASFVGEATPSEVACFDLNNLMDQTNGSRWQPPPLTSVVLVHWSDHQTRKIRGHRLPTTQLGGQTSLLPHEQLLNLASGWTYFALDVEPEDRRPEAVLGELWEGLDQLYCSMPGQGWVGGSVSGGQVGGSSTLESLPIRYGCLAKHTTGGEVVVEGPKVLDDLSLENGWNIISLSLSQPLPIASGLVPMLDEQLNRVWCFDALSQSWQGWDAYQSEMNDLITLEPGDVCYLEMNGSIEWRLYD